MNLVHEVKVEVYSRDEANHTKNERSVTLRDEAGDGRAGVATSGERVLLSV